MSALKRLHANIAFAGIGGPRMVAEGLEPLFPMQELAVMGLVEILPRLVRLSRLLNAAVADVKRTNPAVIVTIDSPGFCLRMLKALSKAGIPRVHYVAPQVWAWREHRVREYPGLWEKLLCLLPFEPAFFARHGLPATFVGHPVLESGADLGDAERFRSRHNIAHDAPVVILMPGSRRTEVGRLLPVFAETIRLITAQNAAFRAVLPVASAVARTVRRQTQNWPVRPIVVTDLADKHDAYAAATAALTKSGTSTLELALAGVPMAVTYRVNPITAMIARRLIRVPHVAMVNLLAGREIVPELLQQDCKPARLAGTLMHLCSDPAAAARQRAGFREVIACLSPPPGAPHASPASAAAMEVLRVAQSAGTPSAVSLSF